MSSPNTKYSYEYIKNWQGLLVRLYASKRVTPAALAVGVALATQFLNLKTGKCFPSQEAISQKTGIALSTVKAAVKELKKTGMISVGRAWFNGPLSYELTRDESLEFKTFAGQHESPAGDTCESLTSQTSVSLESQTYKLRIGTVNRNCESAVPNIPAPLSPSGATLSQFESSPCEYSHSGPTVEARARANDGVNDFHADIDLELKKGAL